MFKKVLVVLSFSASLSYAQAPGKAPDWWCRAEPISLNGDDYLEFGLNAEEACDNAQQRGQAGRQAHQTGDQCGQVESELDFLSAVVVH